MQRNTPLDYAEFLLTRSRTRCELHIFANGVKEKLASGYFKPFATHLWAVEEQFAKGNQVIVLERPSNLLKKNKVTWFTKGTLERFVRFVSTPEVLERVKSIEDELSQLENVRVTLSKTFSQNEVSFEAMDTPFPTSGVHQAKGSISMMRPKSSSGADANEADTSKVELLRAMDVRLVALKQEQNVAFARAEAAGFDSSNMADLLDFSEHFGAERLRDACIQFITLFRKRTAAQEACQEAESPLADAASTGSDMSLESGADFEPETEPELGFAPNVKEAWPKTLKSSNSNNAERRTGWDPKSALKEEKDSSPSHTSARTRSRWGPPARIQINCMEPEVLSLQDTDVSRKMEEAKHHVENHPSRDDSRQSENEMRSFQAGEGLHSTLHLEKQFPLPKKLPGIDVSGLTLSSPKARKEQGDKQGDAINRVGTFFTRLQKMAQQVEARRSSEDLGVRFTSVEMSDESPGSQASVIADSSSIFESALKLSAERVPSVMVAERVTPQPQMQETKLAQGYSGTSSMLQENPKESGLHSGTSNSSITFAAEHPRIEGEVEKRNDSLAKCGEIQETQNENDKIGDIQEKPMSTSARRLSVQAAISLFESKKVDVGEPPTRKLVRQESLKGAAAAQSGGFTSERSVLRRWSAVGSNSFKDTEDKAPDVGTKQSEKGIDKAPSVGARESEKVIDKAPNESEKGIGTGNAIRIGETMSRNTSLKVDKVLHQVATEKSSIQATQLVRNTIPHLLMEKATGMDETTSSPNKERVPQSAADKSSTQASRLLQNTLPYLNIAQQLVHDASDASSKPMPSAQQPVHNAPDASSTLIPSAQQQSVVSDSGTWSSDGLQKQFKQELEQRLTRKVQPNVRMDDMLPSKPAPKTTSDAVLVGSYPVEFRTERKEKESASMSNVVLEVRPNLGKAENQNFVEHIMPSGLVANERAPIRPPGLKEEKAEYSSSQTLQIRNPKHETDKNVENGLLFKRSVESEKEPSLVLHDTSVDLYMQALVMMIDNQQQSSLSLRDEDSYKEQKGRFYEHYLRLRSARQREEPPAKRAEKEAKLKSMKETLERRKAEMEAGALRQRNKGSSGVKEQKHRVQKSGPLRGEEEMGEGEEVSLQDQLLHESKHNVPKIKAQVPKKAELNLQKSASARRGMTTSTSSPRTTAKKSTGRSGPTANHRKSTASSYSGPIENSNNGTSPVDSRRDLVRMAASVKPRGKSNGGQSPFANDAAAAAVESRNRSAVDVLSRTADMDLSSPRKSKILAHKGESPHAQNAKPSLHQGHEDVLESFKVHQHAGPEALPSLVTQNAKPSLHQGHEMLPGVDITKQKVFDSKHSLQKYGEEAVSSLNGYEEAIHCVSEEIGDAGFRNSLELDSSNSVAKDVVSTHTSSTSLDNTCRSSSEGSHCGKEIAPDSLDVEATSCVFEDATSDERILDLTEVDQEKDDPKTSKDEEMPGKCRDRDNFLEKESSRTITSAEKMTAFSPSDSNSSPSVLQESTTSTYSDAVASPENSFEGHFGTVLGGAYSPKPALRMVSPLGSPLSWKSFKTKNPSETDLSHSHSSPQKWGSTAALQQPSKEPAARGFKRLLHFGRKSRASEAVSTGGGISIFTASSGDVETEEVNKELMRLSSEELLGIAKSQEKGGNNDPYVFQDQGATHSLRSSISAPSSNFKPGEDDQLSGGASSKASRSFFSLSTFRSRGSEGKSR